MAYCPYCTEGLPPDARWCPNCRRALTDDAFAPFAKPDAANVAPKAAPKPAPPKAAAPKVEAARLTVPKPFDSPQGRLVAPKAEVPIAAAPKAAVTNGVDVEPAETGNGDRESVYTLETPAVCPHCLLLIRTVQVLRLIRTQVAFTSTLPRGGRAIVCPDCKRILSVELTGLP